MRAWFVNRYVMQGLVDRVKISIFILNAKGSKWHVSARKYSKDMIVLYFGMIIFDHLRENRLGVGGSRGERWVRQWFSSTTGSVVAKSSLQLLGLNILVRELMWAAGCMDCIFLFPLSPERLCLQEEKQRSAWWGTYSRVSRLSLLLSAWTGGSALLCWPKSVSRGIACEDRDYLFWQGRAKDHLFRETDIQKSDHCFVETVASEGQQDTIATLHLGSLRRVEQSFP